MPGTPEKRGTVQRETFIGEHDHKRFRMWKRGVHGSPCQSPRLPMEKNSRHGDPHGEITKKMSMSVQVQQYVHFYPLRLRRCCCRRRHRERDLFPFFVVKAGGRASLRKSFVATLWLGANNASHIRWWNNQRSMMFVFESILFVKTRGCYSRERAFRAKVRLRTPVPPRSACTQIRGPTSHPSKISGSPIDSTAPEVNISPRQCYSDDGLDQASQNADPFSKSTRIFAAEALVDLDSVECLRIDVAYFFAVSFGFQT